MLTRSQALGTRVRVGPLWVLLGGLLLGSPTRLGPAVPRRPGCLWSHPDTPPVASAAPPASRRCPRTPPPSSPLYLGLWGRGLLTRARVRSAQGPAGAQQPRTPWRHMALELGFQALWGAQGAAWQVCGPDGRPGAPSTSQKTRQAGAAPLASGATAPGHRLHGARAHQVRLTPVRTPAESTRHALPGVVPKKTGRKRTLPGHRRLWPPLPGPRLRTGPSWDSA